MKRKPRLRPKATAAALVALGALPLTALGQKAQGPAFALQQVIVYTQPGVTQADLNAISAEVNASAITPLSITNFYKITLAPNAIAVADVTNAVATLKLDNRVVSAAPNYYNYLRQTGTVPTTTPNDPRYVDKSQWNMDLIRMPAAWVLQKGQPNTNAAICDTGGDPTHEDLINQYLADSANFTSDKGTYVAQGTGPELQHGVHISGIIDAITNNSKGVAGICGWGQNVKLLMGRVFDKTGGGATDDVVAAAINYCAQKAATDHIVSINLSLGHYGDPTDTTSVLYQACVNAVQAGINIAVAEANDNANIPSVPDGFPNVIAVAATDRNGQKTGYSNFGKTEIAAPGGAGTGGSDGGYGPEDILSTRDGGYHYEAGCSMACPHVVGVITLLRSVPNVTAQTVFDPNNKANSVLLVSANHTITGQSIVPDPRYGYGLLDAYAALIKVSYSAIVLSPIGINPATGQSSDPSGTAPPPVESLRPLVQFQVSNIPISNVNITQVQPDGTNVQIVKNGVPNAALITQGVLSDGINPPGPGNPGINISGVSTGASAQYTISFRYRFDQTVASAQQTIQITAQPIDSTIAPVTDTRTFMVAPHSLPSGTNLISIPYYESTLDSPSGTQRDIKAILSAPDAALYRWITTPTTTATTTVTTGEYATSGTGNDLLPANATLYPTDIKTTTDDGTDVRPIGLGFFLKASEGTLVRTYGNPATAKAGQSVHIPIREGWNMIGDPYAFEVDFSSAQIQTADGNRQSVSDAATNSLILPFLYSYTGGEYQFDQLPGGTLQPWRGNWIYVIPKNPASLNANYTLTLIVPPTGQYSPYQAKGVRASRAVTSRVSGSGSWSLQLGVTGAGLKDTQNYIGMSSTATDGIDRTKAPKAPSFSPYVSLGLSRSNGALYAQDLRAVGGTKTWAMLVATDQKNTELTVTWPNIAQVPRGTRLSLTDAVTGQTINMRTTHAYTFKPDANTHTRQFTIVATPGADAGRAVISSLFVNPSQNGRGAGGGIYQVSYNLSRAASVDVTVAGPTGRTIGVIQPTRAVSEGANTAVWNGRDNQGRAVPAGPYTLQVRAVTPEGDVTRRTVSVVVTGR